MKYFTKKRILTLLVMVVWLGGCYFIGQSNKKAPEKQSDSNLPQVVTSKKDPDLLCVVDFVGVEKVSKDINPWGTTAGRITMPDGTKAYLLTPGTSMKITAVSEVTLSIGIHPWEKDICTGANVKIRTGDETDRARLVYGETSEVTIARKNSAEISVENDDDESGDWVVISIKA